MPFCAYFASIGRIITGHVPPPKGDFIDILSMDCCHINLIPILLSYSSNSLIHIFLNMSNWTHCWNLRWHVEPEPNSFGSIFHWHPVLRTYRIPSSTFLNGIMGRLTVYLGFSYGKRSEILSHNSSEILEMVDTFLLFCEVKKDTMLS